MQTGTETQININPVVTYTTEVAANRLDHNERGCYADGEVNLTYLLYEKGYRYDMNNCLINEAIRGKKTSIFLIL